MTNLMRCSTPELDFGFNDNTTMTIRNSIFLCIILAPLLTVGQSVNYNPRSLRKDIEKTWDVKQFTISTIVVPDSLYDNILLEKGKFSVITNDQSLLGYAYVGRIYSCRQGGCDDGASAEIANDTYEYFDYYILFDHNREVRKVKVYNYQATHGQEVSGRGWLRQFVGYHGEKPLAYGKNIDSISGATISANAITYNVQEAVRYLGLLQPVLASTCGGHTPRGK